MFKSRCCSNIQLKLLFPKNGVRPMATGNNQPIFQPASWKIAQVAMLLGGPKAFTPYVFSVPRPPSMPRVKRPRRNVRRSGEIVKDRWCYTNVIITLVLLQIKSNICKWFHFLMILSTRLKFRLMYSFGGRIHQKSPEVTCPWFLLMDN